MNQANWVLRNGVFITMEEEMPQATALAIQGDRIVSIGDEEEVNRWVGDQTEVLDLKGAFVYPGFIDSHAHIVPHGSVKKNYLALEGLDKATILDRVAQRATTQKEGEWIVGLGWDEGIWRDKELPSAQDLDRVAPRHPVKLTRVDTHSVWVNHEALRRAKIDKDTPDPAGGKIFRDSHGNPTGILLDQAAKLVYQVMPKQNLQETIELTQEALSEALQKGITMIHNAVTFQDELDSFKFLAKEDALPVRIYAMVLVPDKCGEDFLEKGPQQYGPFLEVSCLKFFIDGALGSRGSALLEPYADMPTTKGLILWKEEDLLPILQRAKTKGFQVAFHAIGDAANRIVLDLYEKVDVRGLRWRIEHAQLLEPSDIGRFAQLEVIASMQPLHAIQDMPWFAERVGQARTEAGAFMWRSLLDSGAIIAGGSDAPVVDINPLLGIYAAMTRQDLQGKPEGGWIPGQRVSRMEALRMYTLDAAKSCFREQELGSLKAGKLADMVVLPENLLTCDPKALIDMKVLYTIVDGKITKLFS